MKTKPPLNWPISPSNLRRRMLCPGSARLEAESPDVDSPDAARGRRLHEITAGIITSTLDPDRYDADEIALAQQCVTAISPILKPDATIQCEVKLPLTSIGIPHDEKSERCRADLIVAHNTCVYVVDFKFGHIQVDAEDNLQLQAYVVAAMELIKNRKTYHAWVVQANESSGATATVRKAKYGYDEREELIESLSMIVRRSLHTASDLLIPGEEQCRFCRARSRCHALASTALSIPAHTTVEDWLATAQPEDRTRMYERLKIVAKWCEEAEAKIKDFVIDGGDLPGYELKPGNKLQRWTDEEAAFDAICEQIADGSVPLSKMIKLVSPSQARKNLPDFEPLEKYVEISTGQPRLSKVKVK